MSLFDLDEDWRKEWVGMPEYVQRDLLPWKQLIINFRCAADLEEFGRLIGRKLLKKRKRSIWWPVEKIDSFRDKRWTDG